MNHHDKENRFPNGVIFKNKLLFTPNGIKSKSEENSVLPEIFHCDIDSPDPCSEYHPNNHKNTKYIDISRGKWHSCREFDGKYVGAVALSHVTPVKGNTQVTNDSAMIRSSSCLFSPDTPAHINKLKDSDEPSKKGQSRHINEDEENDRATIQDPSSKSNSSINSRGYRDKLMSVISSSQNSDALSINAGDESISSPILPRMSSPIFSPCKPSTSKIIDSPLSPRGMSTLSSSPACLSPTPPKDNPPEHNISFRRRKLYESGKNQLR